MTPEQIERATCLFEEALRRPSEERASFLAEAATGDAEVLAEVESLLEHDERAQTNFMRPPAPQAGPADSDADDELDQLVEKTVGCYHIKGVIAHGGMATVYEAVQERPHRTVALKIMKRHVASRSALRRFQFESQILGRLRHANVAQIYEAGVHETDGGRVPYFSMEYVPAAKAITQHVSEKKLGIRKRLRLFAQVCDAVHHGHQKGIIHRDLKPANILVDSAGQPKVIDFGVACGTDSDLALTTQQTRIGQLVGTIQYMSPEQCAGDPHDLDLRSDVYSLGVVLYELLVGELPYQASGTTIYRAAKAITEQLPRKPSSVNRKLRGDVEAIVLKALEKDRERRFQSAAELAADIRRYLQGEPTEARPPSTWIRGIRWIGRHPAISINAAWLVIVLAVCVTAYIWGRVLEARPVRLDLAADKSEAELVSQAGVVHRWATDMPDQITFAELVERPKELGGGHRAILGFANIGGTPHPGALCAYKLRADLEDPDWECRIETGMIPQILRDRTDHPHTGESFGVHWARTTDIFPELPGKEVLVVFSCVRSARAICIYDLQGNELYRVWHDGSLRNCYYWMSDARLLVFVGLAAVSWDDLRVGGEGLDEEPYPRLVFAIRPELDVREKTFMPMTPTAGTPSPVWYKYLLPPAVAAQGSIELSVPQTPREPGRHVRVCVRFPDHPNATAGWTLNEHGEEVQHTRAETDGYKRLKREHPPKKLSLDAWPPDALP